MAAVVPFVVFAAFIMATWAVLSMISQRNSRAQDRLSRLSRPQSMGDIDITNSKKDERMKGLVGTAKSLAKPLMPQTELETSSLRMELSYAGFRSDSAVAVYAGLRFGILLAS